MKGKTVLITGATSGIGYATALKLAKLGAQIVVVARNEEKGEQTSASLQKESGSTDVHWVVADLASFASIREMAEKFNKTYSRLDVLINNAGVWQPQRHQSADGIELHWAVNHLAPFLLTNLLLPMLKKSAPARIINVSSALHKSGTINFDDLEAEKQFSSLNAYSQSKLANVLFTIYLAKELEGSGVTVNCLHPGVINTGLFRHTNGLIKLFAKLFTKSPEQGAVAPVFLASSPEIAEVTGEYYIKKKIAPTSAKAQDMQVAERLWEVSKGYTGLI